MKNVTVVFDLDGTLVDTAPDLLAATNHVLERIDAPAIEAGQLRPTVSHGARAMIEKGLELAGRDLTEDGIESLLAQFLSYYDENIAVTSKPYPGAMVLLQSLSTAGARLAVCTNKREGLSRKLLNELSLAEHFHAIVGRDTLPVCKPDPGHLIGTVILADGNPNRAIMIGDSETDVTTAKVAGIPIIAVSFGYSDVPVSELQANGVANSYGELHHELSRLSANL